MVHEPSIQSWICIRLVWLACLILTLSAARALLILCWSLKISFDLLFIYFRRVILIISRFWVVGLQIRIVLKKIMDNFILPQIWGYYSASIKNSTNRIKYSKYTGRANGTSNHDAVAVQIVGQNTNEQEARKQLVSIKQGCQFLRQWLVDHLMLGSILLAWGPVKEESLCLALYLPCVLCIACTKERGSVNECWHSW